MRTTVLTAVLCLLAATALLHAQVDTAWTRRYSGPGSNTDRATALAVDRLGNVYVAGWYWNGTSFDYVTLKYGPDGTEQWVARYNGPGDGDDLVSAVAVDGSGSVYVTGQSKGTGTNSDYATVRYSPAGETVWVRRYNSLVNLDDGAKGLALDDSGNVYVTGESQGAVINDTTYDFLTVSYSPAGVQRWVERYNGPAQWHDGANAIALDDSGNVCVTGWANCQNTLADFATIKYSRSGSLRWVRFYGLALNSDDWANDVAADRFGNFVITGELADSSGYYQYATVKYNSAGTQRWAARYAEPGQGCRPRAIGVDSAGSVYVTGNGGAGIATVKYDSAGGEQWVRTVSAWAEALAVDGSGCIYVAGYAFENNGDFVTLKYDPTGVLLWAATYDGFGWTDAALAVAADESGYVYVTGYSDGLSSGFDYLTVKYRQFTGVVEAGRLQAERRSAAPTIVSDVLFSPPPPGAKRGAFSILLDITGRKVMALLPGPNDVRALAPGVYFVRSEPSAVSREPSAVTKVVIQR